MRFDDEQTGLHLVVKDDLRQRDVNAWSRAFREWRELNGVAEVPVGRLSNAEYNCGALYGAVRAGWIVESGRAAPDPEHEGQTITIDAAPDKPEGIDAMHPPIVQWYGARIVIVYNRVMAPSPKASSPRPSGRASGVDAESAQTS